MTVVDAGAGDVIGALATDLNPVVPAVAQRHIGNGYPGSLNEKHIVLGCARPLVWSPQHNRIAVPTLAPYNQARAFHTKHEPGKLVGIVGEQNSGGYACGVGCV